MKKDYTVDIDFILGVEYLYKSLKPFIMHEPTIKDIEIYLDNNEYGLALELLLSAACSYPWCIKLHQDHGITRFEVVLDSTWGGRIHDKKDI